MSQRNANVQLADVSQVPRCTIITPARDAANTISETLDSLLAQTVPSWEAIVIDDGSTDRTADIVHRYASRDTRFRLLRQAPRGVAAARNAGISSATTPLIAFLDADDLLAPSFIERMTQPFIGAHDVAATYCGWLRISPNGSTEEGPCPDVDGDLFDLFAAACVFPPHACTIRRSIVAGARGFDERPSTTEDWDLWQRVARTGARFVRVAEPLAIYRMRANSRSRDFRRVLHDGLAVIAVGHSADPRVQHPHVAHAAGRDPSQLARHSYHHACWAAGMALASGEDATAVLNVLPRGTVPDLDPWVIAGTLLEAIRVTLCAPREDGSAVVRPVATPLLAFADALAASTRAPDLTLRVARALDHLLLQQSACERPCTLLTTFATSIELTEPIADLLTVPPHADRFHADVTYRGDALGTIELPVCDATVTGITIADAVTDTYHWELLSRFLGDTVFPSCEVVEADGVVAIRRAGHTLATLPPGARDGRARDLMTAAGWSIFIQELLGDPHLTLDDLYAGQCPSDAEPVTVSDATLAFDLSDARSDLITNAATLNVRCTVGGAHLCDLPVPVSDGRLAVGDLVRRAAEAAPAELVRLAVREGVIGWPVQNGLPLRDRLRRRRREAPVIDRALPNGGVALLRHAGAPPGGAASRHAPLPLAATPSIARLAQVTGTPVVTVPTRDHRGRRPRQAAYVPEPAGVVTAGNPAHGAAPNELGGAGNPTPGAAPRNHSAADSAGVPAADSPGLPILTYHRIAADGPASLAPYRIHAEHFEEQVASVAAAGYRTIAVDEWHAALSRGVVPSRRVLFTFNHGYEDFASQAWPVLKRYGFSALVFLVTGHAGGVATWDEVHGHPAPLLDWPTVEALRREGVQFGSHTVSHPFLTGRRPESVVAELFESRAELESHLRQAVRAFAYPYGVSGPAVQLLTGAAGYWYAMTQRDGRWTARENLLALPRQQVLAETPAQSFAQFFEPHPS